MSNLSQNVKKYFLSKLIDLGIVLLFLFFIYVAGSFISNNWILFVVVGLLVLSLSFISKYTDKLKDKIDVPLMNREEAKKYFLLDTAVVSVFAALLGYFFLNRESMVIGMLILAAIVVIAQLLKYRKMKKEGDI